MEVMKFNHQFTVNSPLSHVADFHRRSTNMAKITPPPIFVSIHYAPDFLDEGAEMDFTLWFGIIPIRWRSRFEKISQNGFVDQQLIGPYKSWSHKHNFQAVGNKKTIVRDDIRAELSNNPIKFLIGLGMWLGMPILFAYRTWKTRRELHRHSN